MKTKKLIAMILILSGILKVSGQDPIQYLSLKETCRLGLENNTNVLNATLDQQKAGYQLKEAKSKLYPQVEGYSNFSYYYSIPKMVLPGEIFGQTGMIPVQIGTKYDWSSGFKASQVLYNQSYFTSLKLSQQLETVSGLTLQQKKEEIIYQISQVYYLCLATNKQISQLNVTKRNTEKLLEIAKLQQEKGIILKADYSRLTVNQNNLQTQIDNLNQLYLQQIGMLKFLSGVNINSNVILTDSLTYVPAEFSAEIPDFKNRTELQIIEKQTEITSLSQSINKQSYFPTIAGFGQYYFQGQQNEFNFFKGGDDKFFKVGVVGLSLNIPIFDGLEKRSKIHQGDIDLEKLRNIQKSTSELFSKEYKDAVLQYENNLKVVLRQQENINTAEESYQVTLQGYRQQVISLSDLLMSESGLTESRLSYYNALLQLNNAGLEVKKSKGELLNY
jgi:outer membrane protein